MKKLSGDEFSKFCVLKSFCRPTTWVRSFRDVFVRHPPQGKGVLTGHQRKEV